MNKAIQLQGTLSGGSTPVDKLACFAENQEATSSLSFHLMGSGRIQLGKIMDDSPKSMTTTREGCWEKIILSLRRSQWITP